MLQAVSKEGGTSPLLHPYSPQFSYYILPHFSPRLPLATSPLLLRRLLCLPRKSPTLALANSRVSSEWGTVGHYSLV